MSSRWNLLSTSEVGAAEPLQLDSTSVAVQMSQIGTEKKFQAVLAHPYVHDEFLGLLNQVAPVESSSAAVTADWKMPDETDSGSKRLQEIHRSGLHHFWTLFESHRQKFLQALFNVEDIFYSLSTPYSSESLLDDTVFNFFESKPDLVTLFERLKSENAESLSAILDDWRDDGRRKRGKRTKPMHDDFSLWQEKQLRRARRFIIRSPLREAVRTIALDLKNERLQSLKDERFTRLIHPQSGDLVYISNRNNQEFLRYAEAAAKNEVVEQYGFKANVSLSESNGMLRTHFQNAENEQDAFRRKLFPLLQWYKDESGQRRWEYDSLDADSFESLQSRLSLGEECHNDQMDALLGMITVAATRPDVTTTWPSKVSLPEGRYEQIVGPAQLPVFVAMQERALLENSGLLSALEEKAM